MNQKYPIKAFDGTNTADVSVLNLPAGSVGANGEIDLGVGVKVYRALLTQTGTDDPVATVLENTLGGEVVWSYSDVGVYIATLAGVFTASKTAINISAFNGIATGARDDANSVLLSVFRASDNEPFNGLLTATFIEILVYP